MDGFFAAETHADKLEFACTHYPRRANPGEVWVYCTTDTYVLGTALANAYAARFGDDADFYRDVLGKDIWKPLRLSPVMDVRVGPTIQPRECSPATGSPCIGMIS
jgi:hypothetical protein